MSVDNHNWQDFRKIFFHEDLPPQDIQDVLSASNLLEIPEFEVFKLAYTYWYSSVPSDEDIEKVYIPYMFEGKVPHFVHHFSRRVTAMQAEGDVDREELGVKEPVNVLRNVRLGLLVFILLFSVQMLIYYMAAAAAGEMPVLVSRCFLPPCY